MSFEFEVLLEVALTCAVTAWTAVVMEFSCAPTEEAAASLSAGAEVGEMLAAVASIANCKFYTHHSRMKNILIEPVYV